VDCGKLVEPSGLTCAALLQPRRR